MTQSAELPIACSLTASQMAQRRDDFRRLARDALVGRERRPDAVRLRFRVTDGVREAVDELVRGERECCPFLAYRVSELPGVVEVEVSGPAEAAAVLDAFHELAGDGRAARPPVGA